MKATLFWIERSGPGRLATLARPRGGVWLDEEIQIFKRARVDVLVSALTPVETAELNLKDEKTLCQINEIEFISFPIADRGTPVLSNAVRELAESMKKALLDGKSIAIHCRLGIGRSSMLAACVLVLEGMDSEAAFELIGQARGCPVPDTAEQLSWVERFAKESRKV
jgi:protein-tyrosine phosphatase